MGSYLKLKLPMNDKRDFFKMKKKVELNMTINYFKKNS
jgi:hypothetical protein